MVDAQSKNHEEKPELKQLAGSPPPASPLQRSTGRVCTHWVLHALLKVWVAMVTGLMPPLSGLIKDASLSQSAEANVPIRRGNATRGSHALPSDGEQKLLGGIYLTFPVC